MVLINMGFCISRICEGVTLICKCNADANLPARSSWALAETLRCMQVFFEARANKRHAKSDFPDSRLHRVQRTRSRRELLRAHICHQFCGKFSRASLGDRRLAIRFDVM